MSDDLRSSIAKAQQAKNRLTDFTVCEVSLVDRAANRRRVLLLKSDATTDPLERLRDVVSRDIPPLVRRAPS